MTTDLQVQSKKQVDILDRYFIDEETIRNPAGFSAVLYRQNLDAMIAELQQAGFQDARVVAVAGNSYSSITHRSGAYLNYHLVAVAADRVLDPLCDSKEPLSIDRYTVVAFPYDPGVRMWEQTGRNQYQRLL